MAEGEIDNLTMEQYLALTRGNLAPGVVKPKIGGNVNFEIKSQFMRELREDTFFGNKNGDAHEHVERVLDIVSLFNILGVSHDAVMLCVLPITLTGAAKRWVDRLPLGTVDSWDLLKKAFIQRALQLRKEIFNFWQLPTELVFEAWERSKSCLRKCPDHKILLLNQILTFYYGITMIDQERLMVASGGNFMRKTPQEAYDLIENMTQHHFQWDAELYYNTTTDMSAHYSETTSVLRERVEETDILIPHHDSTSPEVDDDIFDLEEDIRLIESLLNLDSTKDLPPPHKLNNEIFNPEGDIFILENLLKDDPSEAKNSEINLLIKGPSDTFLIGDEDSKLNPPIDVDTLVPIPRVSKKPLDSLDPILETFKTTTTDP
ncbi:reverse transcriptase domain-containing protein [Tanacetum coccineum]